MTNIHDCQHKSESEKSHIWSYNVFGSLNTLTVSKKKKSLKVFVLVTVCVPEEPNVSDNKDMLCWGLCDCCAFLKQTYLEVFLLYLTSLWVKDRWIIEIGSVIHFLNWCFLATLSFTMLLWLLTLVWSRPGTKFKHNIVWSYSTCIWASEIEKHHEMVLYYHYY